MLQKTYTVDFLTKKRVDNNGEVPKYYVEESHPAIIDKEMWEVVQLEIERRRVFSETYGVFKLDYATLDNPFAGRVICGCCSSPFGRKTWHSTNENLRRKVWMCSNRYKVKGEKGCKNKHIDDKVLYQTFINTFNAIIEKTEPVKEFDVNLFFKLVEKMTVFEGEKIIVRLLDRTEIEVIIE